jgi:hypothetical protein
VVVFRNENGEPRENKAQEDVFVAMRFPCLGSAFQSHVVSLDARESKHGEEWCTAHNSQCPERVMLPTYCFEDSHLL